MTKIPLLSPPQEEENTSSSSSSPNNCNNNSQTIINFALHPQTTLRIALRINVTMPREKITKTSTFDDDKKRFSLLNANRIVSIAHVGVAANAALMKRYYYDLGGGGGEGETTTADDDDNGTKVKNNDRGVALDVVLCAGGSTHVGNTLNSFGFVRGDNGGGGGGGGGKDDDDGNGNTARYSVLALGFNCTDDEMTNYLEILGGEPKELSYLSRERTDVEMKDLLKTYKMTRDEVNMSSLEDAVITRVSSKYMI